MLLADPAYTVPPPGASGPVGTMPWLRATVSRFATGETHTRRRAIAESLLADLDPHVLRATAAAAAARELRDAAAPAPLVAAPPHAGVALPYIPVAVLAAALGVAPADVPAAVDAVRVVAAAYHPGSDAPGADAALSQLLALLPPGDPEPSAQRVALLVQACEATAALVRGALTRPLEDVLRDTPPVPATRRLAPDGHLILVDLAGHPFGAGPRRCPGEAHALALAAGVVEGSR
jgi:cytochrome P450